MRPAPEAPADLALEADPLWQQATKALARVGVVVEEDVAKAWTEDMCTEAAYWSKLVEEKGSKAPPAPKFITPPTGWKPRKGARG